MNIGFYVDSLTDEDKVQLSIESIEIGFGENVIDDASIFYDSIGFTPFFFPCGLFNSTELWSFSGKLLVFSIDSLRSCLKIINNIELYYLYGWEENVNALNLIDMSNKNIKILSKTDNDAAKLYRLTGKKSLGSLDSSHLINLVKL